MALDNWFQSWNPPPAIGADESFFTPNYLRNSTPTYSEIFNRTQYGQSFAPPELLPIILSFSMVKPPYEPHINRNPPEDQHFTNELPQYRNVYPDLSFRSLPNTEYHEKAGPMTTVYAWKQMDFKYNSELERESAIIREEFIPENNLPLGIEIWKNRIFVTMPKWKQGVPATLTVIPRQSKVLSPVLEPYPSWDWHKPDTCDSLVSVFRIEADNCGRLWVLDSGQIEVAIKPKQVCPPALYVFDLKTDTLLFKYVLPQEFIKQDSLYSTIIVDSRNGDCSNVHAYMTDVWRYGLVVFSLEKKRAWRITDHLFFPEPLAAAYKLHGLEFEWMDGLFGLSLSPWNPKNPDRILYFHPMSSFREFYVKTSVIQNETGWDKVKDAFRVMGQSRGKFGHVSASAVDRNGIMFYNLVTRDSVGCWDSRKPYKRSNLGVVAQHSEYLVLPNDLKVDKEKKQSVWVISNRLPFYIYRTLDKNDYNFRILTAFTEEAVKGTICDPELAYFDSYQHFSGDEDCY